MKTAALSSGVGFNIYLSHCSFVFHLNVRLSSLILNKAENCMPAACEPIGNPSQFA
jgi:hypothetical protein